MGVVSRPPCPFGSIAATTEPTCLSLRRAGCILKSNMASVVRWISIRLHVSKHFQHACRFLRYNEKTAGYVAAIERQSQLLREIRAILPPPLDEHCLHAYLEAGVLTLLTDSPVWSSRLRFFTPEVEHRFPPHHGSIVACRIRVQPHIPVSPPKASNNKLSPKTARHLLEVAAGIEDTRIAAALRRLAKASARNC